MIVLETHSWNMPMYVVFHQVIYHHVNGWNLLGTTSEFINEEPDA